MSFNSTIPTKVADAVSGSEACISGEHTASSVSKSGNLSGRKVRCPHSDCNRKLDLVDKSIKCICKQSFCPKHRLPESHSCGDLQEYAERKRMQLKEELTSGMHKSNSFSGYSSGNPPGDHAF